MHLFRVALPVLLLLSVAPTAEAAWGLRFDVHLHDEAVAAEGATQVGVDGSMTAAEEVEVPPDRSLVAEVDLGADWLRVRTGDSERIWDFEQRTITWIDHAERSWSSSSLHAEVYFRDYELANRSFLAGMLSAGGVETGFFEPVELEAAFGLPMEGSPGLTARKAGKGWRFERPDGSVQADWKAGSKALPEGARDGLRRLVVHGLHVHPQVRESIVATRRWPARIRFTWMAGLTLRTETWTLAQVGEGAERPAGPPDGYAQQVAESGKVVELQRLVRGAPMPSAADALADLERRVAAAQGAGQPLDAFLAALEFSLQRNGLPEALMAELATGASEDPDFERLMTALQPRNREEAEAAIATMASLRDGGLPHGRVLDVFRGNFMTSLGDPVGGMEAFLAYLAQAPHSAGPLRDCGMILLGQYQAADAWRVFDLARLVEPEHPLVLDVGELEADLEARHPAFF